jgi:hypothetical protein
MAPNSLVSTRNAVVPSGRDRVCAPTIVTVGNLGPPRSVMTASKRLSIAARDRHYAAARCSCGVVTPMMIAADNCCVEVRPSERPHSLPVHAMMLIISLKIWSWTRLPRRAPMNLVSFSAAEDQRRLRLGYRTDRHSLMELRIPVFDALRDNVPRIDIAKHQRWVVYASKSCCRS